MKPHAYARALHAVDFRYGWYEVRPVPALTWFLWSAATDLGGVAAGKLNSLWFLQRSLVKFECAAYLGTGYLPRTHLPKDLWHHHFAHPCYPVHVPLMVSLGYGATRDLADGCSVQPRAGIQSVPATTIGSWWPCQVGQNSRLCRLSGEESSLCCDFLPPEPDA